MSTNLSPRHLQLRSDLFRRWKTGGLKVGDKIESQNEIIKFCDFSLITVTKTLKDLESEGIIRRQVGKGSFLVTTPWVESYWRVGFFYNRDVVGGGIFDNPFYTRLVIAIEKGVVSDGHEFILGSFTNKSMPTYIMDALDAVVLTGITNETDIASLSTTTSQVSLIEVLREGLPYNSFKIDFGTPFYEMFNKVRGKKLKYLYLDSVLKSAEQLSRRRTFKNAHKSIDPEAEVREISVNQESREETMALHSAIVDFQPDVICGYVHRDWRDLIWDWSNSKVEIYGFALDSTRSGFVVNTNDWMKQVLPSIYENLDNRQADITQHIYAATFNP
ncbi:MAG: GntR family transcriptional regulator [Rhizobiales bacterium]|nr:GntR family transcriptional regulator [Hyphomicrobiales bacterium]NRB14312.1 GntR family transcriptional regulator [Hyphomicrobiales bacterium]